MAKFKIQQQTEAEKDDYLIDCFHDAGYINALIESNYSIVSGRKGTGKTALAKYLESKSNVFGLDYCYRLSIRNISLGEENHKDHLNSIIFFIIIKTAQKLLEQNLFISDAKQHWIDFLLQNQLHQISDYDTFFELSRQNKTGFSIRAFVKTWITGAEGKTTLQDESTYSRVTISNTPSSLIESLRQSLPNGKDILIFIDDISDYLDTTNEKKLTEEISLIKDLLLNLENYNSILRAGDKGLRFVSLIREDLFVFMEGSNINKLISDSLKLEWNERSFAGLLIRRLPFFQDRLEYYLENPIEAIKQQFPDEIFATMLSEFKTNRYGTNFYAYMVAISFNRPRDFLMFCYAMRERLSIRYPALFDNINSAEVEYSDYFTKELKDELFLASRILKYEFTQEKLNNLIDILSKKDGINSSELRTELAKYLGTKTSWGRVKIESFIQEMWWYGILGFKEEKKSPLSFRYIMGYSPFVAGKIKSYIFFLHRGLWWFAQKRRGERYQSSVNR